jgi:hypothetical protein
MTSIAAGKSISFSVIFTPCTTRCHQSEQPHFLAPGACCLCLTEEATLGRGLHIWWTGTIGYSCIGLPVQLGLLPILMHSQMQSRRCLAVRSASRPLRGSMSRVRRAPTSHASLDTTASTRRWCFGRCVLQILMPNSFPQRPNLTEWHRDHFGEANAFIDHPIVWRIRYI